MTSETLLLSGLLTLIAAGGPPAAPNDAPPSQGGEGVALAPVVEVPTPAPPANPVVEIAICLDTSGSMSGLIDAARQKLWAIVNEFVFVDPQPVLRVALYTFGNDGHNAENGWVRQETGLTEDLDLVSKLLFEQTTNGGTELVGRVVRAATRELSWSAEPDALKLIVVAGNESADQDLVVRYADASSEAIAADVMVNAIYCGAPGHADAPGWKQVALLADGQFTAIDHDNGLVVVETPMDARLAALSADLNGTYLAFGAQGDWSLGNQAAQDQNARGLNGEAAASRALCKANGLYNCATWDLVDAMKANPLVLNEVEAEELPEEMRTMTAAQRVAHVEAKGAERSQLQAQINVLAAERQAFVTQELKARALDDSRSFDRAFRDALRSQAAAKGYRFQAPAEPAGAGNVEPTPPVLLTPVQQAAPPKEDGC